MTRAGTGTYYITGTGRGTAAAPVAFMATQTWGVASGSNPLHVTANPAQMLFGSPVSSSVTGFDSSGAAADVSFTILLP